MKIIISDKQKNKKIENFQEYLEEQKRNAPKLTDLTKQAILRRIHEVPLSKLVYFVETGAITIEECKDRCKFTAKEIEDYINDRGCCLPCPPENGW